MALMVMPQDLVATQVNVIHLNFSCQLPLDFQSGVTRSQQEIDAVIELMTFENAVKKTIKKEKKRTACSVTVSWPLQLRAL